MQWSREWFEEQYKQIPDACNQYLSLPLVAFEHTLANQQNMRLESLNRIRESLVEEFPESIADCIRWARLRFEDLFSNRIKQLLHNFPLDKMLPNNIPFWYVFVYICIYICICCCV